MWNFYLVYCGHHAKIRIHWIASMLMVYWSEIKIKENLMNTTLNNLNDFVNFDAWKKMSEIYLPYLKELQNIANKIIWNE